MPTDTIHALTLTQTKSGFKTRKRSKKNIYVASPRPRSVNKKAKKKMKKKREKKS